MEAVNLITPFFDSAKVAEAEKYDGYYAIVTSEMDMSDTEVIETYRGLWEIEETFRVTKGLLEKPFLLVNNAVRV